MQKKLELQARLDSLRARIRPHFLFNTLNSIASLIISRPEAAEQAVEDLSELFRVSLQENHRRTTVADELRLCELYLGIEQLRLGDRLQVDWEVRPGSRDVADAQPVAAAAGGECDLPRYFAADRRAALCAFAWLWSAMLSRPAWRTRCPPRAIQSGGHNLALANIRAASCRPCMVPRACCWRCQRVNFQGEVELSA